MHAGAGEAREPRVSRARFAEIFRSRRMAVLFALGFSSGLPLLLSGQTLSAWMTAEGLSLKTIAVFSLVALPYTFKFLWAPLLDRYRLPFLGRRRGFLVVCQIGLIAAIAAMGSLSPSSTATWELAVSVGDTLLTTGPFSSLTALACCAVLVAFLSASQDIVVDAYNTDLLRPDERAAGSAVYVLGYRVAMLVTGTLALILADHLPWRAIFLTLAALMLVGVAATLVAEEPECAAPPRSLAAAVARPFAALFTRRRIVVMLLFVVLYKFGDQLASTLTMPFYKRELGFTFTEIATLNKLLGFTGTLVGGLSAGLLVARFGVRRMLFLFGALQAATNLLYVLLAVVGKSYAMLAAAVFTDNLANAMGTAAFVALLMSLCDTGVSATQYALLTSLSSLGGRAFGWIGADLVAWGGYPFFFAATAAIAIPALLLVPLLPLDRSTEPVGSPVLAPDG